MSDHSSLFLPSSFLIQPYCFYCYTVYGHNLSPQSRHPSCFTLAFLMLLPAEEVGVKENG